MNISFDNIFNNHSKSIYLKKNQSFLSIKIFDSSIVQFPKLTICIPSFNRQNKIIQLLDLINSYKLNSDDFLILISDNDPHSITNQSSIVSSLKSYKLQIQYYVNEINIGMYENWNRAIFLSKSEWVTLLHDDDLLNINFFLQYKDVIQKFSKYNLIMNSFKAQKIKDKDKISPHNVIKPKSTYRYLKPIDNLLVGSNIYGAPSCGVLINKRFFESNGGFIVNDYIYPANDHFSFYSLNLKSTFIKLDDCFGYYMLGENMSLDKSITIKTATLNYQFRKYLNSIYIKNKYFSKLILEGTNNNLLVMTTNGPFSYHFREINELKVLNINLPSKLNLFLYKLILKFYKIIKLLHLY